MLRSPLIYGGAVAGEGAVPPAIAAIVTNTDMLRATDDVAAPFPLPPQDAARNVVGWAARALSCPQTRYVAVFNLGAARPAAAGSSKGEGPPACRSPAAPYANNTCLHNPRGRIESRAVASADACCDACTRQARRASARVGGAAPTGTAQWHPTSDSGNPCVAWSAFHDGSAIQCNLFRSVGKVNHVRGCVSGGAGAPGPPAPTPTPSAGFVVSLRALGLNVPAGTNMAWEARSVWTGGAPVPVVGGGFVARPGGHDVEMYIVTQTRRQNWSS